jgi:hypothetical protein
MRKAKITESDAGTVTAPSPSGVGVTKIAAAIVTFVTNTVFWNSGIWLKTRLYKDLRVHAGVVKSVNTGDLKGPCANFVTPLGSPPKASTGKALLRSQEGSKKAQKPLFLGVNCDSNCGVIIGLPGDLSQLILAL